jgi:DNA-binding transcriptional LysR family regulator
MRLEEEIMLDAHQLNVFLVAAKTLNFTAAARQLHMTQPSVSQHIHSLEQHFNTELFVRAGRHLRLTDAGAALLPLAQSMVSMSEHIEEKMDSLHGEVHGHLQVGCSTTVGKYVLPFLLASFMRRYPKVQATCLVTPRETAVQMLCDGDVHIALASSQEFCKDVEFKSFIQDPLVLITPLDHPWAERGVINVDELVDAQFIMRENQSGTREKLEEGLIEAGMSLDQLDTILTLGNSEAIALAVQEGIGVGFVSKMVVCRLVQGKVAQVYVNGLELFQRIYIGCHTGHPATTAQLAFWDFVTDPENPVVNSLNAVNSGDDWPSFSEICEMETAVTP